MSHTYLFSEGIWKLAGRYIDVDGGVAQLIGQFRISHAPDAWDVAGYVTIINETKNRKINETTAHG